MNGQPTIAYGRRVGRETIGIQEVTERGSIALAYGHANAAGWEKVGHVVLTREEALAFIRELQYATRQSLPKA